MEDLKIGAPKIRSGSIPGTVRARSADYGSGACIGSSIGGELDTIEERLTDPIVVEAVGATIAQLNREQRMVEMAERLTIDAAGLGIIATERTLALTSQNDDLRAVMSEQVGSRLVAAQV